MNAEKVIYWFIFNVIIALLLFIVNLLVIVVKDDPLNLINLFARGELLIVSAAIAADAIGELILKGNNLNKYLKMIMGGLCVILLSVTSLLFATIAADIASFKPERISVVSLYIFAGTFIISGSSKALTEQ